MAIPSTNPIEIKIRDGIVTEMKNNMTVANGYYYNVGDVNEWVVSNVRKWPRALVKLKNEEILDQNGQNPLHTHYNNRVSFEVIYEDQSEDSVGEVDRDLVCGKLAHDLKKLFGDYHLLSSYGCYQVRPISYETLNSSNEEYPVSILMTIECEYLQQRSTPSEN